MIDICLGGQAGVEVLFQRDGAGVRMGRLEVSRRPRSGKGVQRRRDTPYYKRHDITEKSCRSVWQIDPTLL